MAMMGLHGRRVDWDRLPPVSPWGARAMPEPPADPAARRAWMAVQEQKIARLGQIAFPEEDWPGGVQPAGTWKVRAPGRAEGRQDRLRPDGLKLARLVGSQSTLSVALPADVLVSPSAERLARPLHPAPVQQL